MHVSYDIFSTIGKVRFSLSEHIHDVCPSKAYVDDMSSFTLVQTKILELIKYPVLSITNTWNLSPVSFRIVIKVSCVSFVTDFGNYWRFQLLIVHLLPVYCFEPPAKDF